MGVEDIATAAKAAKKLGKLKQAANAADEARQLIIAVDGIEYAFPPGTTEEVAKRYLWNNIYGPKHRGGEEKITLPSELSPERKEFLEKEAAELDKPKKADVLPFRPTLTDKFQKEVDTLFDPGGMGATPNLYQDFEYLGGFERKMKPSEFLSHTHKEPNLLTDTNSVRLRQGLAEGKKMAPPALWVRWDDADKVWRVDQHEGRHRSALVREKYGEPDITVRLLPVKEGGYYFKKPVTEEQRNAPIIGVGAAAVIPANERQPKKLDPGIYVDEDTGKYFKIDKEGNMEPINETP